MTDEKQPPKAPPKSAEELRERIAGISALSPFERAYRVRSRVHGTLQSRTLGGATEDHARSPTHGGREERKDT